MLGQRSSALNDVFVIMQKLSLVNHTIASLSKNKTIYPWMIILARHVRSSQTILPLTLTYKLSQLSVQILFMGWKRPELRSFISHLIAILSLTQKLGELKSHIPPWKLTRWVITNYLPSKPYNPSLQIYLKPLPPLFYRIWQGFLLAAPLTSSMPGIMSPG